MTADLARAVGAVLGTPVVGLVPVAGGDLNAAFRGDLADGRRVFVKYAPDAAAGAFAAEAAGLRWLAAPGAIAVARPLATGDRFAVLEWIARGRPGSRVDEQLGRGLAAVHAAGAVAFGATAPQAPAAGAGCPSASTPDASPAPTHIGPLALPNDPHPTWGAFYVACRLEPVARVAVQRGALAAVALQVLDRLAARIDDLCGPPEPPARLHGDLWSGNVMHSADGSPVLIDPAAYGGHREIDLAMLSLFGDPGPRFLGAYDEVLPLADGHRDRVALNQAFPLLVHAALFGGGYGAAALAALRRYVPGR